MARWHLPKQDQHADRHKYAGFLARWVAQIRLAYLHPAAERLPHTTPHKINAHFALWGFRSFLRTPIPGPMCRNLTYALHFRQERGETLALLAYCASKCRPHQLEAVAADARLLPMGATPQLRSSMA